MLAEMNLKVCLCSVQKRVRRGAQRFKEAAPLVIEHGSVRRPGLCDKDLGRPQPL